MRVPRRVGVQVAAMFLLAAASQAGVEAHAQAASQPSDRIPGAWASGDGDACRTAPISYFLSDGTYLVFERFDGQLHAVGRWRLHNDRLIMTHNDAPLPDNGAAGAETTLTVTRLDADVFVSVN